MIDKRAQLLLKSLVEHYVADGQPVGSRTLSKHSGLDLSPATIRNVMADLEEQGFITSPHTSAGRIPTTQGYRLFVDSLLTIKPLATAQIDDIEGSLKSVQPQLLISQASRLLSQLTRFAGVVVAPRRAAPRIRQIEFLKLSERRVLLILVTASGEVQNSILDTTREYGASELTTAANYLNAHFTGLGFDAIRKRLGDEVAQLREDLRELMEAALTAGDAAMHNPSSEYVVSGERNLLESEDLSSNIRRLRELFDLFEQRTGLMQLLELSDKAEGVKIFIGNESGLTPLDECSVVTAPYEVDGEVIGSVGVIGPTRMAYDRVIPIVDITARLLSGKLVQP